MWCFVNMQLIAYWSPLNLYYCLLHFAMPCLIKPDMHHTCLCIMPCLCLCIYHVVCFFSIVPISLRSWGFVRLRLVRLHPFIFFMDSFFFLAGSQAIWSLPPISLLSLLASCSFYRYVALPTTCLSCLPYCHVKPLIHLPSKPLFV